MDKSYTAAAKWPPPHSTTAHRAPLRRSDVSTPAGSRVSAGVVLSPREEDCCHKDSGGGSIARRTASLASVENGRNQFEQFSKGYGLRLIHSALPNACLILSHLTIHKLYARTF